VGDGLEARHRRRHRGDVRPPLPARHGLRRPVRGVRAGDRLADLMRSFDLFALPTRREGFGMVFAEAMAFGVVPVGPNIAPVNEVISPGAGLLVEPTVHGFADAIRQCVSDRQRLAEMSATARKLAEERWGGTAAADSVVAVYRQLFPKQRKHVGYL
ncbi:MAG: glycosyltransferase family 4 protein, partial [Pirellulaceae bacterium]